MQKHKRIYLEYFSYGEQDMVPSEYSGLRAEHIHHLTGRGEGKDEIWNLMALTGEEHDRIHRPQPWQNGQAFNLECARIHAEQLRLRGYKEWDKALQILQEAA
jgi:hypothetical protein